MKTVKLIAGILGLVGALIALYVLFISPSYVSFWYPLFSAVFLVLGAILLLVTTKKSLLTLAAGSMAIGFFMFFSHVMNVASEESASGVSPLPDYIPDSIEMIGTGLIIIATILSIVALFGKYDSLNKATDLT